MCSQSRCCHRLLCSRFWAPRARPWGRDLQPKGRSAAAAWQELRQDGPRKGPPGVRNTYTRRSEGETSSIAIYSLFKNFCKTNQNNPTGASNRGRSDCGSAGSTAPWAASLPAAFALLQESCARFPVLTPGSAAALAQQRLLSPAQPPSLHLPRPPLPAARRTQTPEEGDGQRHGQLAGAERDGKNAPVSGRRGDGYHPNASERCVRAGHRQPPRRHAAAREEKAPRWKRAFTPAGSRVRVTGLATGCDRDTRPRGACSVTSE